MFDLTAVALVWLPLGLLFYHWVLFPLVLPLVVALRGRERAVAPVTQQLPSVTIAIAAWNEESCIAAKLRNCLALDYPRHLLEILVGTDAVTDSTDDVVRQFEASGVKLCSYDQRLGKSAVVNLLAAQASGEVLCFTDADVLLGPDALLTAAAHFQCRDVGMVLPAYQRVNEAGSIAEGLWDRYENWLKKLEGKLGVAVGAYGWAMFVRRGLFQPIATDTINDDYVLALAPLRLGYRSVYEPRAISVTRVEPPEVEFVRKVRISRGNAQQLFRHSGILNPKRGLVAWVFFSHKYLRWFGPLLLLMLLVGSAVKADCLFFRVLLASQIVVYSTVALVPRARGWWRRLLLPQYYLWTNLALLVGYWQYLFGRRLPYNWMRTRRDQDQAHPDGLT